MQIILLERVEKLGQMGEVVAVKNGYARNFLIPQGKAMRATKANVAEFEKRRVQLEAADFERKEEALAAVAHVDGRSIVVVRQAGEGGQLYGSVSARDIAEGLTADGVTVEWRQVRIEAPLKTLGLHRVRIALHPEVDAHVTINVARSPDEAQLQADPDMAAARAAADEAERREIEAEFAALGAAAEEDDIVSP